MTAQFVVYYRSPAGQRDRALQLEAQREAVNRFLNGSTPVVYECTDIEAAIAAAHAHRCPIVVATLVGLTASVAFFRMLSAVGLEVHFADTPPRPGEPNAMLVRRLLEIAELEATLRSARSRAGRARKTAKTAPARTPKARAKADRARRLAADLTSRIEQLRNGID